MEWGFTMNFNLIARIMNLDIWKSYNVHSGKETNIRDPRSYELYWTSSWNKTWKKFRHVRDCEHMTSAIPAPYQLSCQANWELVIMLGPNKSSKWWITIIDDCRYMKIIYAHCGEETNISLQSLSVKPFFLNNIQIKTSSFTSIHRLKCISNKKGFFFL